MVIINIISIFASESKDKMRRLLTITALLLTLTLQAQVGKLFDADKQLSSSFTSQVYQDRDGFIWVATRNGLNKYDGYQFQVIKKESANIGMASNYVNCILQDRNGLFYIGMYGAFQSYNNHQFKDIKVYDLDGHVHPPYVTCLLERQNGEILIGTSGHGLLKLTDKDNAHQIGGALQDIVGIHRMMEDSQQHIWLATESNGLVCYDGNKSERYFDDNIFKNELRSVCEGKDGQIYVGTAHNGLYVKTGKGNFEHVAITGNLPISEIYRNRQGELLLGYDGKGVAIFNPQTGTLKDNPYNCQEIDLTKSKCYSIVEDQTGNVWLGLLQKGVYMQPRSETSFNYMGYKLGALNSIGEACISSVFVDSKGWAWVGTDKDGLYCFDENKHLTYHYKDHFPGTVLTITEDQQGRVWIGTYREGCGWIDTKSKTTYGLPRWATVSSDSTHRLMNRKRMSL